MQFICDHNHKFHYPAKVTSINNENYDSFEYSVCPFCQSKTFSEFVEPTEVKGKITALIPVLNSDVNTKLSEGYDVMEDKIYAKETIMIKREAPTPKQPDPDTLQVLDNASLKRFLDEKLAAYPDGDLFADTAEIVKAVKEFEAGIAATKKIAESSFDKKAQTLYDKLDGNKQ